MTTAARESLPAPRSFRKKPVVIEAMQLRSDDDLTTAMEWIRGQGGLAEIVMHHERDVTVLVILTLEGEMEAGWDVGDWIIRGVAGEFYPCKPAIFEATYEAVDG